MGNGMNFWLGFVIIITSCVTQDYLSTSAHLIRNIRSTNEETTTESINQSRDVIDINQITDNGTKINNTDFVNDNFIEDQIALESKEKAFRGAVKYNAASSATNENITTTDSSLIYAPTGQDFDTISSNSEISSSTSNNDVNASNHDGNTENNRSSYSRSYDKYTSPEFQNINNVYNHEVSPEIARYTSSELYDEITAESKPHTKTNVHTSTLTTPSTIIFDSRHKDVQKEIIDNINSYDNDNESYFSTTVPQLNIIEVIKPNNRVNKSINYENIANIDHYDSQNAGSRQSKIIIENSTHLDVESTYLNKVVLNKTSGETTLSPKVNELDYLTSAPTVKTRPRFSLKDKSLNNDKSFDEESNEKNTIVKKPTLKWKPYYLSTQTPTSINPIFETSQTQENATTVSNPTGFRNMTVITKRGSLKYSDTLTTTISPEETTQISQDSVVQENKVHAVHILPPEDGSFDIFSTTESSISTTTDLAETTTFTENLFDIEILDNSGNDSVTNDSADSFTFELDLTTLSSSTVSNDLTTVTTPLMIDGTTVNPNRISLLDVQTTTLEAGTSETTTPSNFEFSTEFDLSTTTDRVVTTISSVNNETMLSTNLPNVNEEIIEQTSTETSTIIPESSTVTTNIIPITQSSSESHISSVSTSLPEVSSTKNPLNIIPDLVHSTITQNKFNKSLIDDDTSEDNLSYINTQSSEIPIKQNTIKTGKSNYLTPTSEEEDDVKITLSSTTIKSVITGSSISTTINYKNIDDNNLHDNINHKPKTTTTVATIVSRIPEITTHSYDYKYGHKTSENNVYKHFSTADENNIHTNPPDSIISKTTTESTVETMFPPEDDETNPITIIAIIIISIAAICLVLLALLLIIMRKRQKRFNYGQRCTPVSLDAYSLDSVSVYNSVRRKGAIRASKRSYGNPAFEDTENISHPMNFSKLANFVNNEDGIGKEYEDIPVITAQANEVPPGCESKNRYANVIPLPETRVYLRKVEGDVHSDYINANFVRGPKNSKAFYIATQAPLENTIDDFWRMIWEQQSKLVIQVTDLYENGVEKCFDYLPPSEVLDCHRQFGDFQITLKKREVKEKYIIHSIQLKNMVSNSWREITHLWYLGWPDRGVPSEVDSMIAFLIEARSYTKPNNNNNADNDDEKIKESANGYLSTGEPIMGPTPIVVHCSPGTGRTGTIITCDILMRDFELTRTIDVPKLVYRIRRDRAGAVQTKDQYAYIYKVINVYATKLTGGALDSI